MAEQRFETSDGATLVHDDRGEGDALLFLPGWSQSAGMFRHQLDAFDDTHRVVALDFRGHGRSPRSDGGYRVHRFGKDVAELLDHLDLHDVTVVGWSMGASVLWAYIDLFGTSRLRRCVFVDEPASVMRQPHMDDDAAVDAGALFTADAMVQTAVAIAGPEGPGAREAFLDGMVTSAIDPEVRSYLLEQNLAAHGDDVSRLLVDHCSIDWSDVFRKVDVPVLVIGGEASHVDHRSQRWIADQLDDAQLVVFSEDEGGAHFPFIEAPDRFNRVLRAFLDGEDVAADREAA